VLARIMHLSMVAAARPLSPNSSHSRTASARVQLCGAIASPFSRSRMISLSFFCAAVLLLPLALRTILLALGE
jgi:hypothetical protein